MADTFACELCKQVYSDPHPTVCAVECEGCGKLVCSDCTEQKTLCSECFHSKGYRICDNPDCNAATRFANEDGLCPVCAKSQAEYDATARRVAAEMRRKPGLSVELRGTTLVVVGGAR